MYIIHFYCIVVEAGFYSDLVECLPIDPESWARLKYFRSTAIPNVTRCRKSQLSEVGIKRPGRRIIRQTPYHVTAKASFYGNAIEVYYIPVPWHWNQAFNPSSLALAQTLKNFKKFSPWNKNVSVLFLYMLNIAVVQVYKENQAGWHKIYWISFGKFYEFRSLHVSLSHSGNCSL